MDGFSELISYEPFGKLTRTPYPLSNYWQYQLIVELTARRQLELLLADLPRIAKWIGIDAKTISVAGWIHDYAHGLELIWTVPMTNQEKEHWSNVHNAERKINQKAIDAQRTLAELKREHQELVMETRERLVPKEA